MAFVQFTRPDDSRVIVNPNEIVSCVPVPADGPGSGPLKKGTRIYFRNNTHQDVRELLDKVGDRLNA